jgi:hypothetical protein
MQVQKPVLLRLGCWPWNILLAVATGAPPYCGWWPLCSGRHGVALAYCMATLIKARSSLPAFAHVNGQEGSP